MARRGPREGARRGATMPRIDEKAASTVQYSISSAAAAAATAVLTWVRQSCCSAAGGTSQLQAERVWSSTLATLALDHQWLANPLPTRDWKDGGGV